MDEKIDKLCWLNKVWSAAYVIDDANNYHNIILPTDVTRNKTRHCEHTINKYNIIIYR